ncbi:MAG TPA: cytochrome P450 [Steroidobacter sp.]
MRGIHPVAKPAHVPDAAVCEFDMFKDAELLRDPHERVRDLLNRAPNGLLWTPHNGGHWAAIGHATVFTVSRDPETFSSSPADATGMARFAALEEKIGRHIPQQRPITLDPPAHGKYRGPLQATFSPKSAVSKREEIRALADSLIAAVKDQGQCDFITSIAEPLPVQVFLKMMGLPLDRQAQFRHLVHEFLAPRGSAPEEQVRRQLMVADAMLDVIKAREHDPKDDIISLLWRTQIDGKPMTIEVMQDYCTLLFIAGLDTVINGIGFGIRHLAQDHSLQEQLRANPSAIPEAAEELLRRYTFTVPMRRIAKDTELAGYPLKKDEWIAVYLPGADLDSKEFPQPEKFDLQRENKVHIAFGAGPHRCLGAHLARVELQVLYAQVLAKLPTFRLDADKPVKFHGGNIIAIDSLPIRWD